MSPSLLKYKVVLYAEDEGVKLASAFIKSNPTYTRIDELLSNRMRADYYGLILLVAGERGRILRKYGGSCRGGSPEPQEEQ